jgi:hypothetical protein
MRARDRPPDTSREYQPEQAMTARPGSNPALDRALAYAAHGWPVFPCRPGSKEPATTHGHRDATTDPAMITAWWDAAPDRNVAIATGAPGPDVLDIDVRPGGSGYQAWKRLLRAGLARGTVALVRTPSGGMHAYYPGTGQRSRRIPAEHVDFKAAGGYVLAPPSRVSGASYQLIRGPERERATLDWPAVANLLVPEHTVAPAGGHRTADPGRLARWVGRLREGNRHDGLFWAACRTAESGQFDGLDAIADAARTAGLPEAEIRRTIACAVRTAHLAAECGDSTRTVAEPGAEAAT